jgi:plasmid stabilization system protein ParE
MTVFDVAFSRAADDDFDAVLHFIARDNPARAIWFVDRLQQRTIDLLSATPFAGKASGRYRHIVLSGYVVVYLVDEQNRRVNIVLVSEGHRDWRRVLEDRA